MFKVITTKLDNQKINPTASFNFKVFNPLSTKDFIFLRSNFNQELNNDYELVLEQDNKKYYKLYLTQQYSNIKILEINNYKFNLVNNMGNINIFEFYYNPIENYIIFVI